VRLEGFPAFAPELAGAGAGFDPSAFAELERLEAASFWFRSRNGLIVWALGRYFPGATSFLEVGCGTGFVLAGLAAARPGLRLTGTEAEPSGLAFAARRAPGATLVQADARRLPFREEFDAAGAFDVLEHIEEDRAVLQALREALRPGGGLLLSVPQHPFLWSEFDVRARHVRRYRAAELREKLLDAGFEIVRMTSFVSLLLPAMWVSRLAARRAGEGYDPLAGLRLAAALDRALGAVAALERALIRAGLSWPFGGSLLAVARRPRGGEGFR
jgi:SAM-dependent methyltransferase